jgi:hypothetical protein
MMSDQKEKQFTGLHLWATAFILSIIKRTAQSWKNTPKNHRLTGCRR